jgi:uncharacterized membrane protein YccC
MTRRTAKLRRAVIDCAPAAALHGVALASASLISFLVITRLLAAVHFVSTEDDYLGGMWAVIATVFVYRTGYEQSLAAALSRTWATLLSFALCLVYLLFLPFTPVGLAVLIGLGSLVLTLLGRPGDVVTAGVTTAVVMVVAALSPHDAWWQPILRLGDTAVGIGIGLGAAWITRQVMHLGAGRGLATNPSDRTDGSIG